MCFPYSDLKRQHDERLARIDARRANGRYEWRDPQTGGAVDGPQPPRPAGNPAGFLNRAENGYYIGPRMPGPWGGVRAGDAFAPGHMPIVGPGGSRAHPDAVLHMGVINRAQAAAEERQRRMNERLQGWDFDPQYAAAVRRRRGGQAGVAARGGQNAGWGDQGGGQANHGGGGAAQQEGQANRPAAPQALDPRDARGLW